MIQTGISIGGQSPAPWLAAISSVTALKGIAGDAVIFEDEEQKLQVQGSSTKCLLTYNLLPNASDILGMAEQKRSLPEMFGKLCRAMGGIHQCAGCRLFTLDLALDRYKEAQWPSQRMRFQPMLSTLVSAPLSFDFSVLLPVSLPSPFPGSAELERSMEMCKSVNAMPRENWDDAYGIAERPPILPQSSLGLCLHLHLDKEMPPETLCSRELLSQAKALVFHYDVAAFETLYDDEQVKWAEYLKENEFNGVVLFAPTGCPEARMAEICQDAGGWAELYSSN